MKAKKTYWRTKNLILRINKVSQYVLWDHKGKLPNPIARPPHEPPAILSCTPGLAGYPFDLAQLWYG